MIPFQTQFKAIFVKSLKPFKSWLRENPSLCCPCFKEHHLSGPGGHSSLHYGDKMCCGFHLRGVSPLAPAPHCIEAGCLLHCFYCAFSPRNPHSLLSNSKRKSFLLSIRAGFCPPVLCSLSVVWAPRGLQQELAVGPHGFCHSSYCLRVCRGPMSPGPSAGTAGRRWNLIWNKTETLSRVSAEIPKLEGAKSPASQPSWTALGGW